ncbi:MAG TPA: hypothetical protein VIR03_01985 [Candidatus Saccharimonadales bacterium]
MASPENTIDGLFGTDLATGAELDYITALADIFCCRVTNMFSGNRLAGVHMAPGTGLVTHDATDDVVIPHYGSPNKAIGGLDIYTDAAFWRQESRQLASAEGSCTGHDLVRLADFLGTSLVRLDIRWRKGSVSTSSPVGADGRPNKMVTVEPGCVEIIAESERLQRQLPLYLPRYTPPFPAGVRLAHRSRPRAWRFTGANAAAAEAAAGTAPTHADCEALLIVLRVMGRSLLRRTVV